MLAHSIKTTLQTVHENLPKEPPEVEPGEEWIRQACEDPQSFATLYDAYYTQIFRYIMRTVMNVDTAEDIVSETFIKALNKLNTYNSNKGAFSSWLYSIATRTMIDHFRKESNRHQIPEQSLTWEQMEDRGILPRNPSPDQLQQFDKYNSLYQAIAELKTIYRLTINLFYFEEKSLKEIAQMTDCTTVTAKWRLHQARKMLASKLADTDAKEILS